MPFSRARRRERDLDPMGASISRFPQKEPVFSCIRNFLHRKDKANRWIYETKAIGVVRGEVTMGVGVDTTFVGVSVDFAGNWTATSIVGSIAVGAAPFSKGAQAVSKTSQTTISDFFIPSALFCPTAACGCAAAA